MEKDNKGIDTMHMKATFAGVILRNYIMLSAFFILDVISVVFLFLNKEVLAVNGWTLPVTIYIIFLTFVLLSAFSTSKVLRVSLLAVVDAEETLQLYDKVLGGDVHAENIEIQDGDHFVELDEEAKMQITEIISKAMKKKMPRREN